VANILIVDDDPRVAKHVADRLVQSGHTCDVDGTGVKALEIAQQRKHDLIILDIMLPAISGFELCRRIRRDANLYKVPILMLSAMSSEEEVMHGLAQGADDFVAKPFDLNKLVQHIEALLRAGAGSADDIDELTHMPGANGTKRELQRMLVRGAPFAAVHCELLGTREFGKRYGNEVRQRAIRHLGRAISTCAKELKGEYEFVGHMGGGHFLAIVPQKHASKFSEWVSQVWDKHVGKLYASAGIPGDGPTPEARLHVLVCVTANDPNNKDTTPQTLFETLSQIRHNALAHANAGTYVDRRIRLE
jgi:DNA-binding response OmpR family regulator